MSNNSRKIWIYVSMVLLIGFSFMKDLFTPDYLNSPSASFLAPQNLHTSRISTIISHSGFWLAAGLYSMIFIIIPVFVLWLKEEPAIAKWVLVILTVLGLVLYLSVFLSKPGLDIHLIPKINRYFHSPVFTLFLIAAIKIRNRQINS